jgi:hypothetical protein
MIVIISKDSNKIFEMNDMDKSEKPEEIKEDFGIVAMIDALGVSNYNIEECKKFIVDLKSINSLNNEFYEFLSYEEKTGLSSNTMKNIKTSQFGDTIVLAWPIEDTINLDNLLIAYTIAANLSGIILHGLICKIPFRGAISVGKYVWDNENMRILGPAVADANNWCNTADWLGIMFTPNACLWLSSQIENEVNHEKAAILKVINTFICKYHVPLKGTNNIQNNFEKLFVVGWPAFFYYMKIRKGNSIASLNPQQIFYKLLFDIPMPKGTESKYENTKKFFEWYKINVFQR